MTSYFYLFYENLMKIKMIININKKIDNDKRYRNDKYCEKNHKWKQWKFVKWPIKNEVGKWKIKIKIEFDKKGLRCRRELTRKFGKVCAFTAIICVLYNMFYGYNICDDIYFYHLFFIINFRLNFSLIFLMFCLVLLNFFLKNIKKV